MSIYIHKSCIWQAFQHNWFTWFSQFHVLLLKFLSIYWHYKTPNSPHTFLWLWILIVEKCISSVLRRYKSRIYRLSVRQGVKNRVNSKIEKINFKNLKNLIIYKNYKKKLIVNIQRLVTTKLQFSKESEPCEKNLNTMAIKDLITWLFWFVT